MVTDSCRCGPTFTRFSKAYNKLLFEDMIGREVSSEGDRNCKRLYLVILYAHLGDNLDDNLDDNRKMSTDSELVVILDPP